MKRFAIGFVAIIIALLFAPTNSARSSQPRQLTFEDRVRAQEAIERVYYSHQTGTSRTFEQAVDRELLEKKVRKYLSESVALDQIWRRPITSQTLQTEFERIRRDTRLPERLIEVYHALGDDVFLMQETLVRAALADKLARQQFDADDRIHAAAHQQAEELRNQLASGELDPRLDNPQRTVVTVRLSVAATLSPPVPMTTGDVELGEADFNELRESLMTDDSAPGAIEVRPEAYRIRVLLEDEATFFRFAEFTVPRTTWDEWWSETEQTLDGSTVTSIALTNPSLNLDLTIGNLAASGCAQDDTWRPTQLNLPPAGRNNHTAIWTGSLMIVWGGIGGPKLRSGGRYDPLTSVWTPTSLINAPGGRYAHTAIWTGKEMIVWGGVESSFVNTGGRYDPVSDSWKPTSTLLAPTPRLDHTAVWTGSEMIVWGGFNASNVGGRYSPSTDTWTSTSTQGAPAPRRFHAAVWTGSQMVIWGGSTSGFQVYDPGGRYDPVEDRWFPISTVNEPIRRQFFVSIWDGRTMFVWGGWSGNRQALETGGRYDPIADVWFPTSTVGAPSDMNGARAVWTGQEILVWGGCTSVTAPCLTNTGGRYDPSSDTWRPITTMNAPSARSSHTAVWTGTHMIVYGGEGYTSQYLDDGAKYDPAADAWTSTYVSRSPEARMGHVAVWTGNLMVLWGGMGPTFTTISTFVGYKYDPLVDWWSPIATTGSPQGRASATAVWSGSEMLIWGGSSGQILSTGGRYNPLTDSWTLMSNLNAPSPRFSHTAIWSGNLMVIWGGYAGFAGELDTGGRYDPSTNTWSTTSLLNAPLKRYSHTAVWTGTEMIVWGGTNSTSPATYALNTGCRYDPVGDRWSTTSSVSAPQSRYDHSAVWTGSEMIIWGGGNYPNLLVDGARFNPVTDTWAPIASSPPGGPRFAGTTIWTGRYMIIWGGYDGAVQFLSTGLRYDPQANAWSPVSNQGAPSPRESHSAVWTGTTMIVWGGRNQSEEVLLTGGQYGIDQSPDDDQDGFSICSGDCDDHDPSINTAAPEVCDGSDNDCDGIADDGNPGGGAACGSDIGACESGLSLCTDGTLVCSGGVAPSSEICDALDNDCDGATDEDLGSTTCGLGTCAVIVDNCLGGHPQPCLPGTPTAEMCNGLDDDCDGMIDDGIGPGTVGVSVYPAELWPPNHRMADVHTTVTLSGRCPSACPSPPIVILTSAISNEADDADGVGDGYTMNDIQDASVGSADFDLTIRAERDSAGDGRLYQVTYMATDCFGDMAVGYGGVFVPHDEGGQTEPLLLDVVPQSGGGAGSYALEWNAIMGATAYDVVRGRMSSIRTVGSFTVLEDAGCLAGGLATTFLSGSLLDENPAPGEALFYLAEYVKGTPSGYGTEASGREMIIGSGDSCH